MPPCPPRGKQEGNVSFRVSQRKNDLFTFQSIYFLRSCILLNCEVGSSTAGGWVKGYCLNIIWVGLTPPVTLNSGLLHWTAVTILKGLHGISMELFKTQHFFSKDPGTFFKRAKHQILQHAWRDLPLSGLHLFQRTLFCGWHFDFGLVTLTECDGWGVTHTHSYSRLLNVSHDLCS